MTVGGNQPGSTKLYSSSTTVAAFPPATRISAFQLGGRGVGGLYMCIYVYPFNNGNNSNVMYENQWAWTAEAIPNQNLLQRRNLLQSAAIKA